MKKYIDKSALVAEIEKFMYEANQEADIASTGECFDEKVADAKYQLCKQIRDSIDSLEVKEVDLEKEIKRFTMSKELYEADSVIKAVAEHFFELGLKANYPITASDRGMAEEIIINLKRVEKDYRIDLTKEIEWLRNKTQKVE